MTTPYKPEVITIFDEGNNPLSGVSNLNIANDKLFFTAFSGLFETGLWSTDGTQIGSIELTTVARGSFNRFEVVEDKLSFQKFTPAGFENWISDGTVEGTFQTSFISIVETSQNRTASSNNPIVEENVDNTSPLKDIISEINIDNPDDFINFDNRIFFTAENSKFGRELWVSDGTIDGTKLFKDITPLINSSNPADFEFFDERLFFTAENIQFGRELWVTDGTIDGTFLVEDIQLGSRSSNPSELTVFDNTLFFSAEGGGFGRELWKVEPLHLSTATDNFV